MNRKPFTPQPGTGYRNQGGGIFDCIAATDESDVFIMRNRASGWTFNAHGVGIYDDDSIDWNYSTDGHFESVSGQQDKEKLSVKMIEFLQEQVPAALCTIDRFGGADDFIGCGHCFDGAEANGEEMNCDDCVVNKIFQEYARVQKEQEEREQQTPESEIFKSAVHWWGKEAQTDMMIEEMAELTKAILNERRGRDHNIAEEMADVRIMLAQMEIIFQNAGEVEQKFREKVTRLDRRLQERRGGAAHE